MSEPTKHTIIEHGGKPAFVVVPYDEYMAMYQSSEALIPQEVVEATLVNGDSMIKAWRKYKGKTQKAMAEAMGITQATYSAIENADKPQRGSLERIAAVLGIGVEQLEE